MLPETGPVNPTTENIELSALNASAPEEDVENGHRAARFRRMLLVASGLLFVAVSVGLNDFRDDQGALTGRFVLPLSAGFSLILLGLLSGTKWRTFAGWFSVLLIGEAAALQMIDAGRNIHFQHYRPFAILIQSNAAEVAIAASQTILVGFAFSKKLRTVTAWVRSKVKWWQFLGAMLFLAFASTAVTPDAALYLSSIALGVWIQLMNLITVVLMVCSVPATCLKSFSRYIDSILDPPVTKASSWSRIDKFSVIAALFVVLLTGSLNVFVYQSFPHVPDEAQYLFQARYMAAGQLTVAAPHVPEAFSMYMVPYLDDRWFGIFSPGWPAMLAVGVRLEVDWLVNPVLSGIAILLAYLFFQRIFTLRNARIAVALLCCSPWFIFMGMSYMGHMFTLTAALAAALLVLNSVASKRTWLCLAAGSLIGVVSLIRPLDGAIVAVMLGITLLVRTPTWRQRIVSSAAMLTGTVAMASLVLPYDRAVTGSPMLMPLEAYYTKYFGPNVMALGFGPERGMGWGLDAFPGHSPLEAMINSALNISLLQTELFGWGLGSLFVVAMFLASGSFRRRDAWAYLSTAWIAGVYGLFWYHGGPDFGARYWFLAIIPLTVLTVRGIEWFGERSAGNEGGRGLIEARVMLAVLSLCAVTLACYIPWRAADKYYHYLGIDPGIQMVIARSEIGRSLVIVRGNEHPDYQTMWALNPVNFEGDGPIYALDRSPAVRKRLLEAYRDRKVWIVDGPSITGGGYRVAAGPLSADELLKTPGGQRSDLQIYSQK